MLGASLQLVEVGGTCRNTSKLYRTVNNCSNYFHNTSRKEIRNSVLLGAWVKLYGSIFLKNDLNIVIE